MDTKIVNQHKITLTLNLVEFVALYDKFMGIGNDGKGPDNYKKARRDLGEKFFALKDETLSNSWPDQSTWDSNKSGGMASS